MENKNESVNKVKPTDKTLENTAALELVAETSEQLKNTVDKNTTSVDRNAERMKQLEQRLAAMNMPVIRYSEDKPEAVQQAPAQEQVKQAPVAEKRETKIQRKTKPEDDSFGSTVADAGKKFAGSVMQAGADFGKSMTDQIGSELLPFYSDMKAAAGKVVGGAVEAGKIVKSKFEKKVEEKKERVKDTRAFIPQSTVEKTEKIERVKELREKIVERKREHAEHKIISILDDIRDKIRAMMLVGLLKAVMPDFSGFGSAIGKFAGMFAKGGVVAALFATMAKWGKDFLKSTGDAFGKIGAGIKDTFNKSIESVKDGWKKIFPDKKAVEPISPNKKVEPKPTEKTPVLDKDGKPVLDKDGKPKFKEAPKALETVETKAASKFETKAMQKAGQTVAIEGAEMAGKDALKGLAARSGARSVAGAAGGPIGEAAAALWMIADFLNTMVEWITGKSVTDRMKSVGPWADENTSLPEVKDAQTRGTGVPVMASGAPAVPLVQIEQLDEKAKAAVQKREDERVKAMMSIAHSSGTNVNNNTVVNNNHAANIPSPYMSDAQQTGMSFAFERAFRRN